MASIMIVRLGFKKEMTEQELEPVKAELERKLKAGLKKEKIKGKRLEWFLKAKKPELVEESAIQRIFKRAGLNKMLKTVEIETPN